MEIRQEWLDKKPDMKYTDMAIYIDNHKCDTWTEEVKEKIFIYLYHLILMLSYKKSLFGYKQTYEDYAIYLAEEMFIKLSKPETDIKSILNYLKLAVSYRIGKYEETIVKKANHEPIEEHNDDFYYKNRLRVNFINDDIIRDSFITGLNNVPITIKNFLSKIPYVGVEWDNIYISCLLTLIGELSISEEQLKNITSTSVNNSVLSKLANSRDKKSKVVLFGLPDSMEDYIDVLTKELKHIISSDIAEYVNMQYSKYAEDTVGKNSLTEELYGSEYLERWNVVSES